MEARLLLFPLTRYAFLLVQLTRSFPSYDDDEETFPGAMHTVDIREAREMAPSVGRSSSGSGSVILGAMGGR